MGKPNVHGLPEHLRKDAKGFFIDYFLKEGESRKRKRVRLGHIPVTQAKRILAEHLSAIMDERFLAPEKPRITFNEAAQGFLAYSQARKKSFRCDQLIVAALGEFFSGKPLDGITLDSVEAYCSHRRIKRPTLSGASLNRDVAGLKAIINRAVKNGQLDKNPVAGFRFFKETPRSRTLTQDEYQKLLGQCSAYLKPIVQMAYVTAMRKGEILGLRWDQVDLQNRFITLEAADTKTQEKREVPLDGVLVELLRQVPRTIGSPHVFTLRGKRILDIKKGFGMACGRAGVKDCHFHDLRHCAITNMRKAGVPDNVIMSISGHKTTAMFRRYDAVDRTDRHHALERLRRYDTDMTRPVLSQAEASGA